MNKQLEYFIFKELFKELGINPYDFRVISGDRVVGYFPNIPEREPMASVDKLAWAVWDENSVGGAKLHTDRATEKGGTYEIWHA